jgi:hypothetical protein
MTLRLLALQGAAAVTWACAGKAHAARAEGNPREYTARLDVSWPEHVVSVVEPVAPAPLQAAEPIAPAPSPAEDEAPEPLDPPRRAELDFELSGLVGAVISHRTGGFTFGGPRFGFRVGHFAMGLSFYPSLTYSTYRERHRVRPGLGFGLEVAYRGVTLFAPVYHIEDHYVPAFGLGYRFHLVRTIRRRDHSEREPRRRRRQRAS